MRISLVLLLGVQLQAAVVFSNFNDGEYFDGVNGSTGASVRGFVSSQAASFVAPETFTFGRLDVPLFRVFPNSSPEDIDFSIARDNNGAPGTVLETMHLDAAFTGTIVVYSVHSILNPTLSAGERYWVVGNHIPYMSTDPLLSRFDTVGWKRSPTDDTPAWVKQDPIAGGASQTFLSVDFPNLAIRIHDTEADVVPEPSSWLLILPALGLLHQLKRRTRAGRL